MLGLGLAVELIERYERFLILSHEEPDGDALGAALALQAGFIALGKKAVVALKDPVPAPFRFLPGVPEIVTDFLVGDYEVLVVVDCGDLARSGFPARILQFRASRKPIINIDHHPRNDLTRVASVNIVDTSVAASVELVADLLNELGVAIVPSVATQLLTGLYTDTGGFKHSNTTPAVYALASSLLAKGARLKRIVHYVATTRTLAALKLWGLVLSRVRQHPSLPLALSMISQEDLERCRASLNDLGGVVNMINSIPGTEAAVLFTELPDGEIKVSIRTERDGIDVSRLAAIFKGGGHKKAAGFRLRGRIAKRLDGWQIVTEDAKEELIAQVAER